MFIYIIIYVFIYLFIYLFIHSFIWLFQGGPTALIVYTIIKVSRNQIKFELMEQELKLN